MAHPFESKSREDEPYFEVGRDIIGLFDEEKFIRGIETIRGFFKQLIERSGYYNCCSLAYQGCKGAKNYEKYETKCAVKSLECEVNKNLIEK